MSELFKKALPEEEAKEEISEAVKVTEEEVETKREKLGATDVSDESTKAVVEKDKAKDVVKSVVEPKKEIPTPVIGSAMKSTKEGGGLWASVSSNNGPSSKKGITLDDEGVEVARQADPDFGAITSLGEEEYEVKDITMIYGEKGSGKSTFALEFPGNILALSLDRKTMKVKKNASGEPRIVVDGKDRGPARIKIYDPIKFTDMSDISKYGQSLVVVFKYIMKLLQDWDKNNPDFPVDWVFIDGAEELARMAEAMMRWRHNLEMEDGIKNRNIWKYRRFIIKQLHTIALSLCKRGVIYTTFIHYDEVIKSGQLIDKKAIPKWLDVIKLETDHVFRVGVEGARYFAFLESGKGIQSQKKFDVTGKELITKVVTEFVEQIQG